MNFCRHVQKICTQLCPKQPTKKFMPPVSTANFKQETHGQESLNKNGEEQKLSYLENPKPSTEKKEKKISESFDDSLYDDYPDFTIRRGKNDGKKMSLSNRSSSTGSVTNELFQRQQRKGNSIFGPPNQPLLKKSSSLESNVKNKTAAPKKRRKPSRDLVKNQRENKDVMVYSALTANTLKPKPNKYWVQTELQYIILLPMDKHKTKSPIQPEPEPEPELEPKKEVLPKLREKESFEGLDSFDSDDSFIPRSKAKPAPKPKGRFCCAKKQKSSSSDS